MTRKIPRVAGTVSVLVFAALLGFIVFSIVQGQEAPKEEERPPGPHPLEGFGPEDLPANPSSATIHEFSVEIGIEDVKIDCTSGSPRLKLRTREPLPPGAEVAVAPRGSPIERANGRLRYPSAGDRQHIDVPEAASVVDVGLPQAIASGDYEHLAVWVRAPGRPGTELISVTVLLDSAEVRC